MKHMKHSYKTYTVGRSPDCDYVIEHPTVSRLHAEMVVTRDGQFHLTDRVSSGGTFVLGPDGWERIKQAFVRADDTVRLAEAELRVGDVLAKIQGAGKAVPAQSKGRVRRNIETGEPEARS
ncbi:FHA domain-containing protein [Nioella ostreopsis]|uniref:FHA domain-containing protein n=1 Tax=Nioella ostreopsis TaxID=2448479 RepID=UPI000FD97465|nr:FHA domain-containing protein [Nioella ostreopsis]